MRFGCLWLPRQFTQPYLLLALQPSTVLHVTYIRPIACVRCIDAGSVVALEAIFHSPTVFLAEALVTPVLAALAPVAHIIPGNAFAIRAPELSLFWAAFNIPCDMYLNRAVW